MLGEEEGLAAALGEVPGVGGQEGPQAGPDILRAYNRLLLRAAEWRGGAIARPTGSWALRPSGLNGSRSPSPWMWRQEVLGPGGGRLGSFQGCEENMSLASTGA